MIELTTLATYIAVVAGFVGIPGPATILTMTRSATSGTRVGMATAIGIAAGDSVHTLMAIVGVSALIAASAILFSVVKYVGAGYLLYLGVRALLEKTRPTSPMNAINISASRAFRQAILAEVTNPKTALFFLAFLPQFVRPENGEVPFQLAVFGAIFIVLGLFSSVIYAASAASLGAFLRRHPRFAKWQGKLVGSIFCALGVRLAIEKR